ncbi:flagellar hook assembly protein FlgD [Lichenifustis flavocetrariae]|uniref:Basal-body rod modification protein FlgD n=1 Tax=Lichenifustis flavocetrariae TaxID=2949735 RepID=A0AA41YTY5_9HYPH|nr:flagellar hook assembly protein FlgD [Lichenifustis flavocetrariae]MCW6508526.1 flagellar hook assembly protein FlgD [Lichenifustis flavocetrariae]
MVTPVTSPTSSSSAGSSASSTSSSSPTVDYNSFLQLLIQEMKNQDPTSPTDPTQYMSQLASFSNVEQGVQTNSKLSTLLTTSSLTQAENLIGKTIASSSNSSVSGVVQSVALATDGTAKATLANGTKITLDNTITVSGTTTGTATGTGS